MNNFDPNSPGAVAAVFAILGIIFIPLFIVTIIVIIGQWKIYTKAGKPGWACIIPIYNIIVMLEIVGKPIWWLFLLLIPCANIIIGIWIINLLSKSFGQGAGFTIGLIFLPFIFYPILGFGNFAYVSPAGLSPRFGPADYQEPFNNPPQV
jgi:hypothetical protein